MPPHIRYRKKAHVARAHHLVWQQSLKDWKAETRKIVRKRDGNKCFYCDYPFNEEFPPTLEHLLPVAAGGSDHARILCWLAKYAIKR